MLASDAGSGKAVHTLIIATATICIKGAGLIRAERPGRDAPWRRSQRCKRLIMQGLGSNGQRSLFST